MKVFLKRKDFFVKVINNSVLYVQNVSEATEFSSMKALGFGRLKDNLEKREKANFEIFYCSQHWFYNLKRKDGKEIEFRWFSRWSQGRLYGEHFK